MTDAAEEATPRIRYFTGWQEAFVQLARPIGFYACLIVLFVNGLGKVVGSLLGRAIETMDAAEMGVFAALAGAWVLARSLDKQQGTQL